MYALNNLIFIKNTDEPKGSSVLIYNRFINLSHLPASLTQRLL